MKKKLNTTEINLETLESYASKNQNFIVEILNIYIEEMPIEHEILLNAIEHYDMPKIVFQAHKMLNNAQLCGVQPLSDLLILLEDEIKNVNSTLDIEFTKIEIKKSIDESLTLIKEITNNLLA
ncbi:MAG: Hpt domain-containing protein [Chitinophagaceae bacterium]|nr:Hpt domain-containing protein [Chitinophagaceae bacterium]